MSEKKQSGMLSVFLWTRLYFCLKCDTFLLFFDQFSMNLGRFWGWVGAYKILKVPEAPKEAPEWIFHRFLMILGSPLGGLGAPLGSIFHPWADPEGLRRGKNTEKWAPRSQRCISFDSKRIRCGPGPCFCWFFVVNTSVLAKCHYREFWPKISSPRVQKWALGLHFGTSGALWVHFGAPMTFQSGAWTVPKKTSKFCWFLVSPGGRGRWPGT